ncbi:helix-turn-helix domain-containing protein [Streptomyces sp. Li-HN-5-11]|uniref:helix-turn-helix domain-containing protein n=1 Tax=Streptomyces sp. Li-HN-5-11 TaxID=3075432 RepID=UPI0028AAC557|nr:helix-turn-helix domain-containing protein [Streptomyces sp. Li-HN-5-11]WNM31715.1 helix-turn-helix domain-containing protein [Streptomyces sp. Li-HN-5-11]
MTGIGMWSTDGLSQTSAPAAWTLKMPELHLPWALTFPERERFRAAVRYRSLDELTVAEFQGGRYAGRRTDDTVAAGGRSRIGVLINLSGRLVCRYGDGEVVVGPHDLMVWDSDLARAFDAVEPHHELSLLLPRDRAPQGLADAAARTNGPLPVGAGTGLAAIAADQLRAIIRELDHLSDAGLAIACQNFFDTLDAALAPAVEASPSAGARVALLQRVRRHVEDHLDDPELSASSIAEALDVSVRTLHLAFAGTGTTVGRWVRERRLKVCYRELARGAGDRTVTDVAFRWGFNDVAHFSRVFKQVYGVTPSSVVARARRASAG